MSKKGRKRKKRNRKWNAANLRQDLRHYTDLSALLHLLVKKKLTLRDPENWDDVNDRHYLTLYKESRQLKSVLALCFVRSSERYHFWRVFAGGRGGVRIRFKRRPLLDAIQAQPGLRWGRVVYQRLDKIGTVPIDQFPFVKRHGFKDEKEFRIIYESSIKVAKLDIPIPLSCIHSIKLSSWLHPDLFSDIRKVLHSVEGCDSMHIVRSNLIDNEKWKKAGDNALVGQV